MIFEEVVMKPKPKPDWKGPLHVGMVLERRDEAESETDFDLVSEPEWEKIVIEDFNGAHVHVVSSAGTKASWNGNSLLTYYRIA